jgi:hypothetical protein
VQSRQRPRRDRLLADTPQAHLTVMLAGRNVPSIGSDRHTADAVAHRQQTGPGERNLTHSRSPFI